MRMAAAEPIPRRAVLAGRWNSPQRRRIDRRRDVGTPESVRRSHRADAEPGPGDVAAVDDRATERFAKKEGVGGAVLGVDLTESWCGPIVHSTNPLAEIGLRIAEATS